LEDSGGYLVGAKIVTINEADQPLFEGFLRSLGAPRQRQGAVNKSSYTPKMTPKTASFGFINRIL
jgi:hypothetical protein